MARKSKKSAPAAEIVELQAIAQVEPMFDANDPAWVAALAAAIPAGNDPDFDLPAPDEMLALANTDMTPDEMLALVDATLPPEEVQEPQAAIEEPQAPEDEMDFDQITGGLDAKAVDDTVHAIAHQINAREIFEIDKSVITGKSNIFRTLKNVRFNLVRSHAARVMIAAQVSPTFINRTLHDGSRYNVYALGKFADLVDALTGNKMSNAINIAIVRTMYAFKKAGHAFTKEVALAAASDKCTRLVAPGLRSLLVSHTVSASTAPTQASSTMQALETLGVVRITGGSRKNPTYEICSNPQSEALEQVAEALAA